jgi:hypothetical protein
VISAQSDGTKNAKATKEVAVTFVQKLRRRWQLRLCKSYEGGGSYSSVKATKEVAVTFVQKLLRRWQL